MQFIIVATRDIKANVFAQPQFIINRGGFLRAFADEVNREDPKNDLWKHSEDFELYELGTYDDNDATFTLLDKPKQLALASNLKVAK